MGRLPENTNMNPRSCPICRHPERAEIERMVLSMSASNPSLTLDAIADAFGMSVRELRVHTLMHTPLALDFSAEAETALIDDFKLRAGQPLAESTSTQGADSVSNNAHSGKIIPRRVTGNCAMHQRMIAKAIKRAREAAIINYVFD